MKLEFSQFHSYRSEVEGISLPITLSSGDLSVGLTAYVDSGSAPPSADVQPDGQGPTFLQALREELGLKLESTRGPIRTLVIDRIERPAEN